MRDTRAENIFYRAFGGSLASVCGVQAVAHSLVRREDGNIDNVVDFMGLTKASILSCRSDARVED